MGFFYIYKSRKDTPRNLKSILQDFRMIFISTLLCMFLKPAFRFVIGALISHEKLLLQINTEREIGDMDYKLGQVC